MGTVALDCLRSLLAARCVNNRSCRFRRLSKGVMRTRVALKKRRQKSSPSKTLILRYRTIWPVRQETNPLKSQTLPRISRRKLNVARGCGKLQERHER